MKPSNVKELTTLVHSEKLLCNVLRKTSIPESGKSYTLTVLVVPKIKTRTSNYLYVS